MIDRAAADTAREVWTRIGNEFNRLRMESRSTAYRTKLQRIHEHFGILSALLSPKDLLEEARRCEEFMGEERGAGNASALDELADFLNEKPQVN